MIRRFRENTRPTIWMEHSLVYLLGFASELEAATPQGSPVPEKNTAGVPSLPGLPKLPLSNFSKFRRQKLHYSRDLEIYSVQGGIMHRELNPHHRRRPSRCLWEFQVSHPPGIIASTNSRTRKKHSHAILYYENPNLRIRYRTHI